MIALVLGIVVAPVAADSKTERARKHFRQGEAYRKAKAFDLAVAEYEAAYAQVPKAGFLFNVGLVYEEAGEARKAVAYYRRFLEAAGEDDAAAGEARARMAALERTIAAEDERAARELRVAALAAEGAALLEAGKYDAAVAAFRSAYAESNDPAYLYDEAEAIRRTGRKADALAAYERYRSAAPAGPRVGDAVAHIAAIEAEIAEDARIRAIPVEPPPSPVPVVTEPAPPREPPRKKEGISWLQLAAGAALVGGGIALDVLPASGENQKLDPLDFVPVAMYGVGTVFVVRGVF